MEWDAQALYPLSEKGAVCFILLVAMVRKFYLERSSGGDNVQFELLKSTIEALSPGRWVVTLEKYKMPRTTKQNNFYWGNFITAQIECFKERWGETYRVDQVHDWNKANFWGTEHVNEETGEVIRSPASSTDNNTVEWETKLDVIRQWFRQNMDWEIGYPEKQEEFKFKNK